ncbi:MAG: magnesium transporter [Gammaproteobacteria bacterium]
MKDSDELNRRLRELREALDEGMLKSARRLVNRLHPADIALLLESLPLGQRRLLWGLVDPESEGDILVELHEDVQQSLIGEMDEEELVAAAERLELDDLADLLGSLPETVTQQVLRSLDQQDRDRLSAVLAFPEDSAGGLMNPDTVSVRPDVTLDVVLRYLRMRGDLPARTDALAVVDRHDRYVGMLSLTRLLTEDGERTVSEVLDASITPIAPETSAHDVSLLFQGRDLLSAPVVDREGRLLGRITIDDVVDVIREEAEHPLMGLAGLDDEADVFGGAVRSARRRSIWLGINLATAFLASWVVGLFDAAIEQVVVLAVLMPVVASMGGVAGTQTVTLIIRGLALGQVQDANARSLLLKELAVGALNGLLWATVVSLVTWLWFGRWEVAAVLAAAMLINLCAAGMAGVLVPLALRRLRVDPALAGGVVLTTVTDCVGFAALLGLGTWFLI